MRADPLAVTQAALPISLIATRREHLFTCSPQEKVSEVVSRHPDFDHIPVTEDGHPASRILGLLAAHRLRQQPSEKVLVQDVFEVLREEHLIGSDAPIIEFILEANKHDCRLLVSGRSISGIVTASDLQALPVRAALFTLITRLEVVMAEWIKRVDGAGSEAWLDRLPPRDRGRVRQQIRKAALAETFVDDLSCTYFGDKTHIICGSDHFKRNPGEFKFAMLAAKELRNALAHAHEYASTRAAAQKVCITVQSMHRWIEMLTAVDSWHAS